MTWWNNYVGIPYAEHGRVKTGADCWGLVRIVYKENFNIDLPSFVGAYDADDKDRIAELFATNREGWERVESPMEGDVVAFRIYGEVTHVGVVAAPGTFLHVRRGTSAAIERLEDAKWKNRVDGFFRYKENLSANPIVVSGMLHPLRTERIDGYAPAGMSLQHLMDRIESVKPAMPSRLVVMVNGLPIERDRWVDFYPIPNDRIEIRAVAQDSDVLKTVAFVALVIYAPQLSGEFFASAAGQSIIAATPFTYTTLVAAGSLVLTTAGSALLSQIFPYRPPSRGDLSGAGLGESIERQLFLQGGTNQIIPYGAVPVVLGSFRYAGPAGMTPWVDTTESLSYLNMIVVWGYGPLSVTEIRIADTPIENFDEVQIETLDWQDTSADKKRFNKLSATEVVQNNIGLELECTRKAITSATRTSNVLTVVTTEAHGFSTGWFCRVYSAYDETNLTQTFVVRDRELTVVDSTTFTVASTGANGSVTAVFVDASSWIESSILEEVDDLGITVHFPEGTRTMILDGGSAGQTRECRSELHVERRKVNPSTGAPLESYKGAPNTFNMGVVNLPNLYILSDLGPAQLYGWTRVSISKKGLMVTRRGSLSESPSAQVGNFTWLQEAYFGNTILSQRLPTIPSSELLLYDICVYGDTIYQTIDHRAVTVIGGDISYSGLTATIAPIDISADANDPRFEMVFGRDKNFLKKKDAYSYTAKFDVEKGAYQVRVRRANYDEADITYGGAQARRLSKSFLQFVTGIKNTRPIVFPKALAMSAIRIKATNQINGNVQGVSALVQSVCLDYDHTTSTWITRPTNNPASLFRYVLQHPANAQAVANGKIDLDTLEDWHDFCRTKNFAFNTVVVDQKSLFEVMKDVCAAGRASPTLRDGKWSVVIDKPQSVIRQHFTPHNSWGFSATRIYPKMPHAFRVAFSNEQKGFQPDEMFVYNDGYNSGNATYFEALSLPGVTNPNRVFQHGRFHLAQLKLRPESYTINVDMEHIVCTRGDLVRITHDVPLWGRGSGRIKLRAANGLDLTLEEEMLMIAGTQYGIRIRLANGTSITRTVAAKLTDGYYSQITLTTSVTATQGAPGNLFMFGDLNAESVECIVQAIEPLENYTARITLVDYSPAIYTSDDEPIPAFNSRITRPQKLVRKFIKQRPTIVTSRIKSDETVMSVLSPGVFEYNIRVPFTNAAGLDQDVQFVEGQIDYNQDSDDEWGDSVTVRKDKQVLLFKDVEEGDEYRIRLRYVDTDGNVSNWTTPVTHTVIGKTSKPQTPGAITFAISNSRLKLDWPNNTEPDLKGYELRSADSGWGGSGFIYRGSSSEYLAVAKTPGTYTYYLKARDLTNLYSTNARSGSFTILAPTNPSSVTQTIVKTTKTVIELAIDWNDVIPTSQQYPVGGYEVRTTNTNWGSGSGFLYRGNASAARLKNISATSTTTFFIRTYDLNGNYATSSFSFVHDVTAPGTMAGATVSITRLKSILQLSITSAPSRPNDFEEYEFQIGKVGTPGIPDGTTDNFWNDPDCLVVDSTTTKAQIDIKLFPTPRFSTSGVKYRVAVRMRDKSGNYSPASALGAITVTKIT